MELLITLFSETLKAAIGAAFSILILLRFNIMLNTPLKKEVFRGFLRFALLLEVFIIKMSITISNLLHKIRVNTYICNIIIKQVLNSLQMSRDLICKFAPTKPGTCSGLSCFLDLSTPQTFR